MKIVAATLQSLLDRQAEGLSFERVRLGAPFQSNIDHGPAELRHDKAQSGAVEAVPLQSKNKIA